MRQNYCLRQIHNLDRISCPRRIHRVQRILSAGRVHCAQRIRRIRHLSLLILVSAAAAMVLAGCPTTGDNANSNTNSSDTTGGGATGGDGTGGDGGQPGTGDPSVWVDAGADQQVVAESLVTLSGSGSVSGSSNGLTLFWAQTAGPAVMLSDAAAANPTFVAPAVTTATALTFQLTISKNEKSNLDTVTVTVVPIGPELPAPPADSAQIAAAWKNGAGDSQAVIHWQLPATTLDSIAEGAAAVQGQSLGTLASGAITNGVHRLTFELSGSGPADVSFGVDVLGYRYNFSGRLSAPLRREIGIEVLDGVARVLFNGWFAASDSAAGGPTGAVVAETLVAWRGGSDTVDPTISFRTPLTTLPTSSEGAALQGFERASYPIGVNLSNGQYQLTFEMSDSGRSADITYFANFPGYSTRVDQRVTGPDRRLIGLDVLDGTARVFFDGWKSAGEAGAGGVTGVQPVEVVGAWRNGSANVSVTLDLYVNNVRTPYTAQGFALQGYQRVYIPAGSTVADGTYRIECTLSGLNRTANVALDAKILNYTLSRSGQLVGVGAGITHTIVVQVTGGVAAEVSNTWTQ